MERNGTSSVLTPGEMKGKQNMSEEMKNEMELESRRHETPADREKTIENCMQPNWSLL